MQRTPCPLELPIRYERGKITMQMLKSYANIGEAIVWVQQSKSPVRRNETTTKVITDANAAAAAAIATAPPLVPVIRECSDEAGGVVVHFYFRLTYTHAHYLN